MYCFSLSAISSNTTEGYKCKKQRKFKATPLVVKGSDKRLERLSILCTAPGIIIEVRYSNESLCACEHVKEANMRYIIQCQEELSSLDIIVYASTNNFSSGYKKICDVDLRFFPATDDNFQQRRQISIIRPEPNDPTVSVPSTSYMTPSKSIIRRKSQTNSTIKLPPVPRSVYVLIFFIRS